MQVETLIEDERWKALELEQLAERAAKAVFEEHEMSEPFEISFLGCDDARISILNKEFRGAGSPTNVLSWPSAERSAETPGLRPKPPNLRQDSELGDIAISYDTCIREAEEAGKPLPDHVMHLLVHGILHLLGYDHENDADATLMEQIETKILGKLGIADPY